MDFIFAGVDSEGRGAANPPNRHLFRAPGHRAGIGRTGGTLCGWLGRGHPRDGGFGHQVTCLPDGAIPLATSNFCRYEGFRIGRHIVTFQGHPEFTVDYERHLILNHAENEDDAVKQRALETLRTMDHQGKTVVEFLLDSFRTLWACK